MKNTILFSLILALFTVQISFSQKDLQPQDSIINTSVAEINKQHPILSDRFIFNAGVFIPSKEFKLSIDGASENDLIDINKDFGFNKSETIFAGNFMWRFTKNKKWSLSVEYFGVKSNHNLTLEKEIEWDGTKYSAGVNVDAGFRLNIYRIFFGRSIIRKQHHELGGGLGVHAMDIRTFIEGQAFVGDAITPTLEIKSVSVIAPVPNIGFWYYYTPNEKWALTARVDWFAIQIGDYGGSLWNVAPGVKYQVFKNIGVGVNYRYIQTSVNVDKANFNGDLDLVFKGPLFTISGNF